MSILSYNLPVSSADEHLSELIGDSFSVRNNQLYATDENIDFESIAEDLNKYVRDGYIITAEDPIEVYKFTPAGVLYGCFWSEEIIGNVVQHLHFM